MKKIIGFAVVAVLIIVGIFVSQVVKNKTTKDISINSKLMKAIYVQDLSTAEFIYNGVAQRQVDGKTVYIMYGSSVKAGIDFNDVIFEVNEESKQVVITLPQLTIGDPELNLGMIDYMPSSPNLDIKEVIRICKNDVKDKALKDQKFLSTAAINLKSTIKALITPLYPENEYEFVFYQTRVTRTKEEI